MRKIESEVEGKSDDVRAILSELESRECAVDRELTRVQWGPVNLSKRPQTQERVTASERVRARD